MQRLVIKDIILLKILNDVLPPMKGRVSS